MLIEITYLLLDINTDCNKTFKIKPLQIILKYRRKQKSLRNQTIQLSARSFQYKITTSDYTNYTYVTSHPELYIRIESQKIFCVNMYLHAENTNRMPQYKALHYALKLKTCFN